MRARRVAAGLTLIELVVIVCVVGVLAAILLERLLVYQEIAEKTGVERTLGVLRSAMALRAAALMTGGRFQDIPRLREENPMGWLADRPSNYVGERYAPPADEVPAGSWYFDRLSRELVYRPRIRRHLDVPGDPRQELRFRAVVELEGVPSATGQRRLEVTELSVAPTRPYRWDPGF